MKFHSSRKGRSLSLKMFRIGTLTNLAYHLQSKSSFAMARRAQMPRLTNVNIDPL